MKAFVGKTLMLVENYFPSDTRVKNEADLLTEAGFGVSVVALRKKGQSFAEVVDGIQVYRIPELVLFQKTPALNPNWVQRMWIRIKSLIGYVGEYCYFTLGCWAMSCYVWWKHGFDVVHAHNPPDTLWVVGGFHKLWGKKFIFDHHDLSPELYESRYGAKGGVIPWGLLMMERMSLALANTVIATNESYRETQIQRGNVKPEQIFIVRNGPNPKRMALAKPSARLRAMNKFILGYIGSLNPQDGVDYLLRSLHHLVYRLKRTDFYCVIMGSGDSLDDLRKLAKELKLEGFVELTGFISEEALMANLGATDICLDPDPASPLNNVSTWIKIMEYMAQGKPIVSFDLKETRFSAQEAAFFVQPNDEEKFAEAIVYLMENPELRRKMGEFGRKRVEEVLQWRVVGMQLLRAYGLKCDLATKEEPAGKGEASIQEMQEPKERHGVCLVAGGNDEEK